MAQYASDPRSRAALSDELGPDAALSPVAVEPRHARAAPRSTTGPWSGAENDG
jgi:hypothetical protein